MARRFSGAPEAPKVKPLRYRIDPTAEQSDQLDSLLTELESIKGQISGDDYLDMVAILKGRQQALTKRVDRIKGTPKGGDCEGYRITWLDRLDWEITPFRCKLAIVCAVVIWIISKNL